MIISPAISIYDDGQKHDLVPGGGSKIMAELHELAPAILRACSSALYQETSMKKCQPFVVGPVADPDLAVDFCEYLNYDITCEIQSDGGMAFFTYHDGRNDFETHWFMDEEPEPYDVVQSVNSILNSLR